MTTTAINFHQLSKDLGATPKRLEAIFTRLFGTFEVTAEQATPHLKAVLEIIKKDNKTPFDACDSYKLEIQKQQQQQTSQATPKTSDKPGNGSLAAILENDRKTTKALTQKRYVGIVKESNQLLASWLMYGLPEGGLSTELEDAIFDSSDLVLDAMSEVIDSTGEYAYPQALAPAESSIARLLLSSQDVPTASTSNGNGKH
jgi:hypothetical protein